MITQVNKPLYVYEVPVTDLLSDTAAQLWKELKSKEIIELDELADTIATILKDTFDYDFERANAIDEEHPLYLEEEIVKYRETMRPDTPTLQGVCLQGSLLGKILLDAVNMQDATPHRVGTTISPEQLHHYPEEVRHSILAIEQNNQYRLINNVSGSLEFGVPTSYRDLDRLGRVCLPDETGSIVSKPAGEHRIVLRDFRHTTKLSPQEPTIEVFYSPDDKIFAGELVAYLQLGDIEQMPDTALVKVLKQLNLEQYNKTLKIHNMDLTNVGVWSATELEYDQRTSISAKLE
jgi:hypothetical protein